MLILVGCEFSQRVTAAFRRRGHEAYSCDLLDGEINPEWHLKMDVFEAIKLKKWDMGIFHPPCTYLCSSGLHWNKRVPERALKTQEAITFTKRIWYSDIPRIALENPIGCLSTEIGKPTQIIQPYNFGEDASKSTCLWLKNLPLLKNTEYIKPRTTKDGKKRWANQTDSGQSNVGPSEDRWKLRSITYTGIAEAIADQWCNL